MEHLFNDWESVARKIDRNDLFIFLDFDGTLTPIVSTPEKAVLSDTINKLLKEMSDNPNIQLAFISGRRLEDIKSKIKIKNAIYSGNHGLQLEGPKVSFESFISYRYQRIIERIKSDFPGFPELSELSRERGKLVQVVPGSQNINRGVSDGDLEN